MAPRITRRVLIETYFDFIGDLAKCKLCSHTLKSNRIFNLKTHVIKVHKIRENEFKSADGLKNISVNYISERKAHKQVVKLEISKQELLRSYIGLVTEEGIPFTLLDSGSFKNIIEPIRLGLSEKLGKRICLDSSRCKKELKVVADNIRNEIASDLNRQLFSLKIDSASGLSQSFVCISAQFLKSGELQSRLLGIVELKSVGANCRSNLARDILNILAKYDANLSQIVSITSDNGANMMKTTFSDDVHNGQNLEDGNDMYIRNIKEFEDSAQINLGDIELTRYVAYTAQLCALCATKDSEIKNFLFCCRNFVKFLRKPSNGYTETFELKDLTLPQLDYPTKLGSTYSMITCLKSFKDIVIKIEPIENKSSDEYFELNESFWNFIKAYCIVFEPLQLTIVKLQEEQLHYGSFYAEWLKCKLCTEKINEICGNKYVKKIANILQSMETITEKLLNNESLLACLYLDPRFNHTLTLTRKLEVTIYLKKPYDKIKNINTSYQEIKTEELPASSTDLGNIQFSQKGDEYLNEFLRKSLAPNGNGEMDVSAKIENLQIPFLGVDSNAIKFWRDKRHNDPELYALSNVCFSIPSSHIAIEHDVSFLRFISADNDNDILENILLIKYNDIYLEQAIEELPLFEGDR